MISTVAGLQRNKPGDCSQELAASEKYHVCVCAEAKEQNTAYITL
jgi:hypothetical protein